MEWNGVIWGPYAPGQGSSGCWLWLRCPEGVAEVAQETDSQMDPEEQRQPQLEGGLRVPILITA